MWLMICNCFLVNQHLVPYSIHTQHIKFQYQIKDLLSIRTSTVTQGLIQYPGQLCCDSTYSGLLTATLQTLSKQDGYFMYKQVDIELYTDEASYSP